MSRELDNHINNFLSDFRAKNEATVGPNCVVCGKPRTTYCEGCLAGLCDEHADKDKYEDVAVCKDDKGCEFRCGIRLQVDGVGR